MRPSRLLSRAKNNNNAIKMINSITVDELQKNGFLNIRRHGDGMKITMEVNGSVLWEHTLVKRSVEQFGDFLTAPWSSTIEVSFVHSP